MKQIAVILAAGKGTRMKSEKAKVVHEICGRAMISWVVQAIKEAGFSEVYVVCGHRQEDIRAVLKDDVQYIHQKEQLGTGHAVITAMDAIHITKGDVVLVTCGDTPLIQSDTYRALLAEHMHADKMATVLTTKMDQPTGYGRILRDNDSVRAIVEEKDAAAHERAVKEINAGTYVFDAHFLQNALLTLNTDNAQGEFYLTDTISVAHQMGNLAGAYCLKDCSEILGVNNRLQLSQAEAWMQKKINMHWMMSGVTMVDPNSTYIGAEATLSPDVHLEPNVIITGKSSIGEGTFVGMNTKINNSNIGARCNLQMCVINESAVGDNNQIGPFAYLRPGTVLKNNIKIGDFVEIKNATVGNGSKVPHLSYVGDASVGEGVNIGCGTITCNYDGRKKHRTNIGDGAFIGSNTNLIAPVSVGESVYVGAGATIRENIPSNCFCKPEVTVTCKPRRMRKEMEEREDV